MQRRTAGRLVVALGVAGLLISAYLTLLHYDSSVPLVCSAGSYVNCETVLTSPSATFAGVPVAVWGILWFAVALALVKMPRAALAWSAAGMVGVLYLVYQEVGIIGKLCAWCTAVHVIIGSMLIVQAASHSREPAEPPRV